MSSLSNSQLKLNALEAIKNYRVSELQTLLDHANIPRHGQKRDLLHRCKLLISSSFTQQLANKIQQINRSRPRSSRSNHVSSSSSRSNQVSSTTSSRNHPVVLPKTPPTEVLPLPNQIQFVNLPFFEKMRTIECANMPVDWHTFSPVRFLLNETDIDLIRKNSAKIFLRIAPTILQERHNDVLPPYILIQCNNQPVVNNNTTKQVGTQAHSISFPTDITDKLILKANTSNTLTFLWLQTPTTMSFKNLPKSYTLTIQLVHCVSLDTLFDLIVKRERYSNRTNDDNDSDIEIEDLGLMTTRHRVSLLCPITQSLIVIPAKSSNCSHLTCFDLKPFLQMNERRLQWTCPICKKPATFETLRIDERLQSILSNVPPNCSTVEVDSTTDCHYILDSVKQEKIETTEIVHTHRTNEDESVPRSRHESIESDCIVLSSGSENEDEDEDDNNINNSSDPINTILDQNDDIIERQSNNLSGNTSHSTPSPVISTIDDGNYWEDLAQITYDLSSDASERQSNRKRTNSSTSSVLSSSSSKSNDDRSHHHHHKKRSKQLSSTQSRTDDIEIITLSSSDNSDNDDDQLS